MMHAILRHGRRIPYRRCLSTAEEAVESANGASQSVSTERSDVNKPYQKHGTYAGDNVLEYTSTMEIIKPEKVSDSGMLCDEQAVEITSYFLCDEGVGLIDAFDGMIDCAAHLSLYIAS